MAPEGGRPAARVHFDDALFEADLARASVRGRAALAAARSRLERDGMRAQERRACSAEHRSGTRLPGCVKVYVPDMAGPWRMVSQVAHFGDGALGLEYVVSGSAHLPCGTRRRDVYELAHFRLHGEWPGGGRTP